MALAQRLINERLAACVNVLADCTSIYRWEGKNETAVEVPVLIKTLEQHYAQLEQLIKVNAPLRTTRNHCCPNKQRLACLFEMDRKRNAHSQTLQEPEPNDK